MSIVVRQVGSEAAGTLASVHAMCRSPEHEEQWSAAAIATLIKPPGATALLAGDAADRVVGLSLVRTVAEDLEILALGVVPAARRRGVAGALLRAIDEVAARARAERVVLEVAVDNEAAARAYRRHGFVATGRRRDYYRRSDGRRVDALVMAKALPALSQ